MKTTCKRRAFLGQMAVLAAAGALPSWALSPMASRVPPQKKEIMLDQLTLADFSSHLESAFALEGEPGGRIDLKLIEAVALGSGRGPRPAHLAARGAFSVVFLAPREARLAQRTYRVRHEAMGEFEIFLVPIGLDPRGLKCEAIFN